MSDLIQLSRRFERVRGRAAAHRCKSFIDKLVRATGRRRRGVSTFPGASARTRRSGRGKWRSSSRFRVRMKGCARFR